MLAMCIYFNLRHCQAFLYKMDKYFINVFFKDIHKDICWRLGSLMETDQNAPSLSPVDGYTILTRQLLLFAFAPNDSTECASALVLVICFVYLSSYVC